MWYSILMVAETTNPSQTGRQGQRETVQQPAHHGMMISPTKEVNLEANVVNAETVLSLPLEALQAALTGLLSGDLKVKDGAIVAYEKAPTGPRGPTAKVAPRLEACQALMVQMAGEAGGVTAKALLEAGSGTFLYTDILLVARNLIEAGTIQESRHGRKATWNLTTKE